MLRTELDRLVEIDILEEKAEERGRRLATVETKQDVLLHLMREKFGSVPEATVSRVRSLEDTETLDRLLGKLIHADDLAAMGL